MIDPVLSTSLEDPGEMNYYYLYMGLLFVALVVWAVIALHRGTGK